MGVSVAGDIELVRVTLIDYFTCHILVDSLVYPGVPMRHYATRYSGVTKNDMELARQRKTCFFGVENARAAVWQFVGPGTIVVGHSANCDLTALRWLHPLIIDTFLLELFRSRAELEQAKKEAKRAKAKQGTNHAETETVEEGAPLMPQTSTQKKAQNGKPPPSRMSHGQKAPGPMSLKTLAKTRLNRNIQMGGDKGHKGHKGHDSLEDAIATRDLVHWFMLNGDTLKPGGGP